MVLRVWCGQCAKQSFDPKLCKQQTCPWSVFDDLNDSYKASYRRAIAWLLFTFSCGAVIFLILLLATNPNAGVY